MTQLYYIHPLSTNGINNKFKWFKNINYSYTSWPTLTELFVLPTGTHVFLINIIYLTYSERQMLVSKVELFLPELMQTIIGPFPKASK